MIFLIYFNSEKARKFLLEHGLVFTLRSCYNKSAEYSPVVFTENGKPKCIGMANIFFQRVINEDKDLLEFVVAHSGFKTKEEWFKEASKFKCSLPACLYLVVMLVYE